MSLSRMDSLQTNISHSARGPLLDVCISIQHFKTSTGDANLCKLYAFALRDFLICIIFWRSSTRLFSKKALGYLEILRFQPSVRAVFPAAYLV